VHRVEHAVEIDAPPDAVFPYLAGAEPRLRWMGALRESEQLTEGPPAVGSRWRDVFEDLGQRIELEAEVEAYEPPRLLRVRLSSRPIEATSEQRLEWREGRTRVTTVLETEYKSFAARLAAGVVTHHAQKQLEADLATLKGLVESEAAD
jgi:uncharacterized protein YndB with AHSA1/START domain